MTLVACVQLMNLPVALARRDEQALAERPLVLYTVGRERASVYAASDDAGVITGMPLHRARGEGGCPPTPTPMADSRK